MYAPTGDDRYKVYIIDEAHMLTKEAWNALLKIIEEPPPRVVFVFATTEPQRIANTAAPILSRVQRFDLRRMAPADVRARLEAVLQSEQVRAEPEALTMLARAADGSMRDALSLTDQVLSLGTGAVTAELVRETLGLVHDDEILGLLDAVAAHRAADIFPAVARLADQGADFTLLFAGVLDALRAELALVLGAEVPDLSERMRDALAAAKGRFAAGDLLRMLNLAVELEPHFRRSAQQQLLFEMLLVRFALLDRTVDIESVIRGVAAGGGGGASVFERPRDPSADRPHPPLGRPRDPSASQPQPPLERPRTRDAERRGPPPRMHDVRRVAEAPSPAATLADAPQPDDVPPQPLDINRLAARWDDVVEAVRLAGRGLVASALAESTPTSVAGGVVTVQVTSDALGAAIEGGAEAILAALHTMFTGVTRLVTARAEGTPAPARRMTESEAIANRVARLRKEAPLLDAAFDVLDLRLIE